MFKSVFSWFSCIPILNFGHDIQQIKPVADLQMLFHKTVTHLCSKRIQLIQAQFSSKGPDLSFLNQ